MIKKIAFFLFFLVAITASARDVVVSGTVTDSKNGEPLEMATVKLMRGDSTIASGISDIGTGKFHITARKEGKYSLRISFVSYHSSAKSIEVSAVQDTMKVGNIALTTSDISLSTAVVTATAARVEQKGDTTMFNASAYRVPEGSTLESLVKQLPGVEVGSDGTITWNGKTVSEFLINGKDFFKGDTKIAMKNLPTTLVSKVKAYDKKSDYTEQTGIDDGEETTVMDLTTKRELNQSWITNVDLGYGTKSRYTGKFFGSRFTDNSHVTAFASLNNVGDKGFTGGGPGFRGGENGGLTASKMAGFDGEWDNGKKQREAGRIEVGGNVRYNYTGTDSKTRTNSETFLTSGAGNSWANSASNSMNDSKKLDMNARLQWNPDSMTNIMFRPSYSHSSSTGHSNSQSVTFNADPYADNSSANPLDSAFYNNIAQTQYANSWVNTNNRYSLSDSKSDAVDGSLMVIRRFGKAGRNVSLRLTGNYQKDESHSYSLSNIKYNVGSRESFLNQYNNNPSKSYGYAARVGYAEPLGKGWFAQVRYNFQYKYSDRNRSLYNLDSLGGNWNSWQTAYTQFGTLPTEADLLKSVLDSVNSQYATYKYYMQTISLGIRYNTSAINFNAGVDLNPQTTKLNYQKAQMDTTVTRNVFYVSPQVRFRYKISNTNRVELNYRGSATQPSMTDLLDVTDNSDPLNISKGNPGLKPSWTNTLRAMYNSYNSTAQQGMMAALNFSQTSNSISNSMTYDATTGVRTIRPENINGNWSAQGHFMFNTGMGLNKNYTFSTFSNVGYNNSVGFVSVSNNTQKNTNRTLKLGERINLAYRNSWFDIGLNGSVDYQHSKNTIQSTANLNTCNYSYGASANFNFDWGMSLSTDASMNSRRGYSDNSMNTNELIWNAQLSQSFLKGKAATISLQFYDILHQQSNVSRSINAQMRSDTWTNAINSYAMVHFIYRLNIFGGKSRTGDTDNNQRGFGNSNNRMSGGFGNSSHGSFGGGGGFGGGGRGNFN